MAIKKTFLYKFPYMCSFFSFNAISYHFMSIFFSCFVPTAVYLNIIFLVFKFGLCVW